tara:strand:- start:553 stop:888 length:336 start_codon:yes stop_codon:yes gene_type:complete
VSLFKNRICAIYFAYLSKAELPNRAQITPAKFYLTPRNEIMAENNSDDVRKQALEQAEAGFEGFIKWTKYGIYGSLAFLLAVGSCNFGVENKSFPAYNGEQYSPSNLNIKN